MLKSSLTSDTSQQVRKKKVLKILPDVLIICITVLPWLRRNSTLYYCGDITWENLVTDGAVEPLDMNKSS